MLNRVLFLFLLFIALPAEAGWLSGYDYRIPITVAANTYISSNTTEAIDIVLTSADTDYWNNKYGTDGGCQAFTSSDGITELSYKQMYFDNTNQDAHYSVTATFSSSASTTLYLYVGTSELCADHSTAPSVVGQYSFDSDNQLGEYADVGSLGNDLTNSGAVSTTGKWNSGVQLSYSDGDYIDASTIDGDLDRDEGTIEFTGTLDSMSATGFVFGDFGAAGGNDKILIAWVDTLGVMRFQRYENGGTDAVIDDSTVTDTTGGVHQWIFTWSVTNNAVKLYVDGTQSGSTVTSIGTMTDTASCVYIGKNCLTAANSMNGMLDYMTIYSAPLTTDQIAIRYNSFNETSGFITLGSAEDMSADCPATGWLAGYQYRQCIRIDGYKYISSTLSNIQTEITMQDQYYEHPDNPLNDEHSSGVELRDPSNILHIGNYYYRWDTDTNNTIGNYTGSQLRCFRSPDYLNDASWSDQGVVLTKGTSGDWDDEAVFTANAVVSGSTVYVFYTGSGYSGAVLPPPIPAAATLSLGVATVSTSTPCGTLTKSGSNPILQNSTDAGSGPTWMDWRIDAADPIEMTDGSWRLYFKGVHCTTSFPCPAANVEKKFGYAETTSGNFPTGWTVNTTYSPFLDSTSIYGYTGIDDLMVWFNPQGDWFALGAPNLGDRIVEFTSSDGNTWNYSKDYALTGTLSSWASSYAVGMSNFVENGVLKAIPFHGYDGTKLTVGMMLPQENSKRYWQAPDASGTYMRFTQGDGTTLIKQNLERFDASKYVNLQHVKVPSVSSSTNTYIYAYWGNSGSPTSGDDPANTWSTVTDNYHLNSTVTGGIVDDSTGLNDLTNSGTSDAIGIMDLGARVSLSDGDYLDADVMNNDISNTQGTIEAYVQPVSISTSTDSYVFDYYIDASNRISIYWDIPSYRFICSYIGGGTTKTVTTTTPTIYSQEIYQIGMTYDTTADEVKCYVNGAAEGTTATSLTAVSGSGATVRIGSDHSNALQYNGIIDEVTYVAGTAESADWFAYRYHSSARNLVSFGPFEGGQPALKKQRYNFPFNYPFGERHEDKNIRPASLIH